MEAISLYLYILSKFFRSVKFHSNQKRKLVVEEEIIDEGPEPPPTTSKESSDNNIVKNVTVSTNGKSSTSSWLKSTVSTTKKKTLSGLVKVRKVEEELSKPEGSVSSGLSLLGAYSDSGGSSNED